MQKTKTKTKTKKTTSIAAKKTVKTVKTKKASLAIVVGILFVTGLTFANAFNSGGRFGIPTVFGNDQEDSEDGKVEETHSENSSSKGEKSDEKSREMAKKQAENLREANKKQFEDEREFNKKQFENQRELTKKQLEKSGLNKEGDDEDEVNGQEDQEIGDVKDEIQELSKKIARIESKISVLASSGSDVSSFMPMLTEIKDLAAQAQILATTDPLGAKGLFESVDHKLERLNKLVRMTLGDSDEEENENDSDATEKMQELAKKIVKIEANLATASSNGVDVASLRTTLNDIKEMLTQVKEKVTAGDLVGAKALTEIADKKLEGLKHSMEIILGDDDNESGDEADEYKDESAKLVHNIQEIGDIEEGIKAKVGVVVNGQVASVEKVESSIDDINSRSGALKFLVGPKYGSIAEINQAIVDNQARIKVLNDLMNQIPDPAVKAVLQEQIVALSQQNAKLQAFVVDSESGFSLLGWLAKMFQ